MRRKRLRMRDYLIEAVIVIFGLWLITVTACHVPAAPIQHAEHGPPAIERVGSTDLTTLELVDLMDAAYHPPIVTDAPGGESER